MSVTPEVASSSLVGPATYKVRWNLYFRVVGPFVCTAFLVRPTRVLCNRCARVSEFFVLPHRFLRPDPRGVEVRVGCLDVRVPEELLYVMNGHSTLEPARPRFVSQIMNVQI